MNVCRDKEVVVKQEDELGISEKILEEKIISGYAVNEWQGII